MGNALQAALHHGDVIGRFLGSEDEQSGHDDPAEHRRD